MNHILHFTHANLKNRETGEYEPVMADASLVGIWYYSKAMAATIVMLSGGAAVPVRESVEQITKMKQGVKINGNEET